MGNQISFMNNFLPLKSIFLIKRHQFQRGLQQEPAKEDTSRMCRNCEDYEHVKFSNLDETGLGEHYTSKRDLDAERYKQALHIGDMQDEHDIQEYVCNFDNTVISKRSFLKEKMAVKSWCLKRSNEDSECKPNIQQEQLAKKKQSEIIELEQN